MTHRKASRTAPRKINGTLRSAYHDTGRSALLHCRHTQEFRPAPEIGDEVYCRRCHGYRHVLALQSDYRARCRDCNYSRPFGRAMFAADGAARRHGDKKGHTVDRYDGSKLEWTYEPGGPQQLTIESAEEPPF